MRLSMAIPVLTTEDVRATLAWWVGTLGFEEDFAEEDFAGMRRDDVTMYLCHHELRGELNGTQAWVIVTGVDELYAEWSKVVSTDYSDISGPALTGISDQPWGREFALRDPSGNCVHFAEDS